MFVSTNARAGFWVVREGVRACSCSCPQVQVARPTAAVTRARGEREWCTHVSSLLVGLLFIGWLVDSRVVSVLLACLLARSLSLVPVRAVSRLPLPPPTLFHQAAVLCQRPGIACARTCDEYIFTN